METATSDSFKGNFLVAMPSLVDPNFEHTVTCICEHTSSGAVGLVINREHPRLMLKAIFEELKVEYTPGAETIPIHIGGPVHPEELFILHGPPFEWQGCLMITESLALGNTRDILEAIAMQKGPTSYLVSLGCAGWGPGQLESEMRSNAWLTSAICESIIFDRANDSKWEKAIRKIGADPTFLTSTAGHA